MANRGIRKLIETEKENKIPVLKQQTPKKTDEQIISEYESVPDYNIGKRLLDIVTLNNFNTSNREKYQQQQAQNDRQFKLKEYQAAKDRQISAALNEYQPQNENTIPMLAGSWANEKLHPFQYAAAQKEIQPYLEEKGITLDQLDQYYKTQALREQNKQMAQSASDHPVLNTLNSIAANQIGALNTGADAVMSLLQGKPLGSNTAVDEYADLSRTIRGNINENIKNNAKTQWGGELGSLAYNVGTSLGDMGMSMALGGFNEPVTLKLMAYNAGANTLDEQKAKNTTDAQKLATALASYEIEYWTNKLPLENLFRLANNPAGKQTAKQIFRNIVGQMASEGSEELVSDLANAITDNFFNQSQSDYQQSMAAYMAQGMTRDQAQTQAMKDIVNNAMYSGLAGALSGGVMAGGASAINNSANSNVNNDIPKVESKVEQTQTQNTTIPELLSMATNDNYSLAQNGEVNPWAMQEQGETIADRIRSMRGFEHTDFDGRMVDEPIPTANQKTETKALKPLESYDAKSIKGFPDITKQISKNILWYGKDNEVVAQKYAEAIQNINRYLETYDQKSINDAVNALTEIDKQLQGKTNTYNGKTYTYPSGSIVEQFIDDSKPLYDMARHNALGTEIPQIKAENKTTDYSKLDKAVGMYANAEGKKTYGQIKQYIDRYAQTGDEKFLNLAKNMIPVVEQSMKGKSYKAKDKTVYNYKDGRFTKDINKVIPQIGEKSKSKRSQVMAEDIGLNPKSNEDAEIPKVTERGDELVKEIPNINTTTRFATNSMLNNMPSLQNEEGQNFVWQGIENGDFNKGTNATNKVDVLHNKDAETQAKEMIQNNMAELEQKIANGDISDPVVFEALLTLQEEANKLANETGDWSKARYYGMKAAGKTTDSARILQLLAKRAERNTSNTITKTDILIKEGLDTYFKKNKSKRTGCSRLASALKNIGNDYTQPQIAPKKTFEQIKQSVINELGKESSSVFDNFTPSDVDFITNMVEKGFSAKEIQSKLEQRMVTGKWEYSDADLNEVNRLLNEARQYDVESKKGAELEAQAYAIMADYLPPSTFFEKWNAWRYLAMLGNPRTHIRNIIGNMLFCQVAETMSDKVGAILEGAAEAAGIMDKQDRTKTLKVASADFKKAAQKYMETHAYRSLTEGGDKYLDMKKGIEGQKKIFGDKNIVAKGLQKALDISSNALTKEDVWALEMKYRQALTNTLLARGYDESIFNSTNPKDIQELEMANEYAIRRAKEATFHEDSKFSNWWRSAVKSALESDSKVANAAGMAMDTLMPFVKTPANILKMSLRYTPANIANALYNAKNPARAIEDISRALTGTMVMALGMFLKSHGILRTRGEDDEKQLDKLTGQQDFSMNINGKSYTLDWAAPSAVPLFLGAEMYRQFVEKKNYDVMKVLEAVADPVTEMSMLQGLNNTINTIAKNRQEETPAGQLAADIGFGYASQGIPTLFGQIARTVDDTRRNTYYTGKSGSADQLSQYGKKTASKIPVLSETLEPQVDAWGQDQKNSGGNMLGRLLLNTVSPGYYSNVEADATESELYRLNKDTNGAAKKVMPTLADSKPLDDQDKLSAENYTEWAHIYGQNLKSLDDAIITNDAYKGLTDVEKISLLNDARLFANALSLDEMNSKGILKYDISTSSYKKEYEAYKHGGVDELIDYITISKETQKKYKADDRKQPNNGDYISVISEMDATKSEKAYYLKQRLDYTEEAKFIDAINPEYAYDWYIIRNKYGDNKADMELGISLSDLPEEEKKMLLYVNGMKKSDVKLNNVMNGITE